MWYVTQQGKPDPLYSSLQEPKARLFFRGVVGRGRDTLIFHLLHDSQVVEEQKGGQIRLDPTVQPKHVPPIYPTRK